MITKKHAIILGLVTVALIACLSGLSIAMYQTARHARHEAIAQHQIAVAERRRAEAATAFLTDVLTNADPSAASRSLTVRQILDRATARLDEPGLDPAVRARLEEQIEAMRRTLADEPDGP